MKNVLQPKICNREQFKEKLFLKCINILLHLIMQLSALFLIPVENTHVLVSNQRHYTSFQMTKLISTKKL